MKIQKAILNVDTFAFDFIITKLELHLQKSWVHKVLVLQLPINGSLCVEVGQVTLNGAIKETFVLPFMFEWHRFSMKPFNFLHLSISHKEVIDILLLEHATIVDNSFLILLLVGVVQRPVLVSGQDLILTFSLTPLEELRMLRGDRGLQWTL